MRPVVMITGATKNTGFAIAERFAAEGYNVCVTSRDGEQARAAAVRLAQTYAGCHALGLALDPACHESLCEAFAAFGSVFDRLDAFVSNAANLGVGLNVFNTSPEAWDAVMNANARGTFFCCQQALQFMKPGGAICMVSSVHAHQCIPERIVYAASKGAINAMTHALALETGHLDIRVNAVVAGAIWSDRWEQLSEKDQAERRARYPIGRESTGADIANGVYYLCSDQSRTVTGTELIIDSGISVCLLPFQKEWRPK